MAERYARLFALENGLYAPGAPVLIAAGALLKDSYSANIMAQMKFINLGPETVSALKVSIQMLDAAGEQIGKPVEYQYTDLSAAQDAEFGRNVAIVLPKSGVRSFSVQVTEAQFEGGGSWKLPAGAQWGAVSKRQTLEEALESKELAEQYRVRYGNDCVYAPAEAGEALWYCTCGVVNPASEQKCRRCRRALSAMKTVNIDNLRSECEDRLKLEQEEAEAGKEEAKQKNKKLLKIAAVAVPVLILVIVAALTLPPRLARMRDYTTATAMLAVGEFDQAQEAFLALGDYRDSAQQAQMQVPYLRAVHIMELAADGDESGLSFIGKRSADAPVDQYGDGASMALLYQAAQEIFNGLGDYQNSAEMAGQCQSALDGLRQDKLEADYAAAAALLDEGKYSQARAAFLALGDFEDSAEMAKEAVYQKGLRLYGFTEAHKVRYVYAGISVEADTYSVFSVSTERALEIGSDAIGQLREACGGDSSDIRLEDSPAPELKPILASLEELFSSLGDYKDSKDYAEKLQLAQDYTRPFFQLCEEGDVYGAYDWLTAYEEEFADRERWLELLEMYKPFCGTWTLFSGDPTLIPLTAGSEEAGKTISTGVTVALDKITLHIRSAEDGEAYHVLLSTEPGSLSFSYDNGDGVQYISNISVVGRLAYMKYYTSSGSMVGSCDYSKD